MFHSLKSPGTLDNSTITLNKLDIMAKNILYLTHEIDKLNREIKHLGVDKDLQHQVDKYFDEDETSPQTESDEH